PASSAASPTSSRQRQPTLHSRPVQQRCIGRFFGVERVRHIQETRGGNDMSRTHARALHAPLLPLAGLALTAALTAGAAAQTPRPFATTKVDGTDNVYIFRYGAHQSMFIVTPQGVIATDPISERRPAKPYIEAIQAVTKAPIKYVIYSHSHYD